MKNATPPLSLDAGKRGVRARRMSRGRKSACWRRRRATRDHCARSRRAADEARATRTRDGCPSGCEPTEIRELELKPVQRGIARGVPRRRPPFTLSAFFTARRRASCSACLASPTAWWQVVLRGVPLLERGATDEQFSVAVQQRRAAACDAEGGAALRAAAPMRLISGATRASPKENDRAIVGLFYFKGKFGSVAFERAAVNVPMPFKCIFLRLDENFHRESRTQMRSLAGSRGLCLDGLAARPLPPFNKRQSDVSRSRQQRLTAACAPRQRHCGSRTARSRTESRARVFPVALSGRARRAVEARLGASSRFKNLADAALASRPVAARARGRVVAARAATPRAAEVAQTTRSPRSGTTSVRRHVRRAVFTTETRSRCSAARGVRPADDGPQAVRIRTAWPHGAPIQRVVAVRGGGEQGRVPPRARATRPRARSTRTRSRTTTSRV